MFPLKCRLRLLARRDGSGGADIGARAAVYANIGVNGVLFALGDGSGGAFVDASAAGNAFITNYVSHNQKI